MIFTLYSRGEQKMKRLFWRSECLSFLEATPSRKKHKQVGNLEAGIL